MPRISIEKTKAAATSISKNLKGLKGRIRPITAKVSQYILREAQRRAPRGKGVARSIPGLKRSLNAPVLTDTTFALSSPLPYAAVQNFGGVIRAGNGPLKSKYLAIPVNDAAKLVYRDLGSRTSLRTLKLRITKSDRGNVILIGEGDDPPIWVLKRSVNIPAQKYAPDMKEPKIVAFISAQIRRALRPGTSDAPPA